MEIMMSLDERINAFMAVSFQYFCGNRRDMGALGFDLRDILEVESGKEQSSATMDIRTRTN
jgi:hypothetical protein